LFGEFAGHKGSREAIIQGMDPFSTPKDVKN